MIQWDENDLKWLEGEARRKELEESVALVSVVTPGCFEPGSQGLLDLTVAISLKKPLILLTYFKGRRLPVPQEFSEYTGPKLEIPLIQTMANQPKIEAAMNNFLAGLGIPDSEDGPTYAPYVD